MDFDLSTAVGNGDVKKSEVKEVEGIFGIGKKKEEKDKEHKKAKDHKKDKEPKKAKDHKKDKEHKKVKKDKKHKGHSSSSSSDDD